MVENTLAADCDFFAFQIYDCPAFPCIFGPTRDYRLHYIRKTKNGDYWWALSI